MNKPEIPIQEIASKIYLIRGHKVMLDSDLAAIYDVTTFNLNKAVKRNLNRFPPDFMFQLSNQEVRALIFQIGISKQGRGGRRSAPYVFTQEGVAMLSSALNSDEAINVNIMIMRAFVKLRDSTGLIEKVEQLEKKYDHKLKVVFDAIRELMSTHSVPRKRIIGLGDQTK
jgi:phage regulator Rha-like protein